MWRASRNLLPLSFLCLILSWGLLSLSGTGKPQACSAEPPSSPWGVLQSLPLGWRQESLPHLNTDTNHCPDLLQESSGYSNTGVR